MAGGIRAMFGTDTKTLHMGRAAQNGLLDSQLASHGFESCPRAIESWASLVSTTVNEKSLSALSQGSPWQILENTFKPYPCGIVIHPLIDAALKAYRTFREDVLQGSVPAAALSSTYWSSLERIEATVNPQCVRLCSIRHPNTGLETIFSLYHGIAVALLYGQAGPTQFSDQGSRDELTKQLRDKIDVYTDEKLADDSATLKMTFTDRKEQIFHIEHATGSLANPMTSEQLEIKFRDLSSGVLGHVRANDVIGKCWNFHEVVDMHEIMQYLVPS